ncbi:hypothetical protein P4U43_08085 [Arthrobacter sp. EH-1B-1]|uniref:Uncharacterized protein n=1 Tax=Arthrobacter vasquezii TaxID=2977629 RepID=A0ABT6CUK7_9MICC|nr:hypothetical protein [Arthrobacter vasquezii]MDF9277746.1 hypothetical protein [Arthrobacter vasquezii]
MGNWKRNDNQPVSPLWLERTNQKYGEADWSNFFGGLMYPSNRHPVIQWIEQDTGAGLILGQGSEPWEPVQSLEVLYAPPHAGVWRMPLYNNDWYPEGHKDAQRSSYEQTFERVMQQVTEFLTIEAMFLDMFYPSTELDYLQRLPSGPYG